MQGKIVVLTILLFTFFSIDYLNGQELNYRFEYFSNQNLNFRINQSDKIIHSGVKPLVLPDSAGLNVDDSLDYLSYRDRMFSPKFKSRWIYRKLRTESFIDINTKDLRFKINPLFNFEFKKDNEGTAKMFTNTRAVELRGDIGRKIYFYSSFYENQARYEPYISEYIDSSLVVPGQGAPKFGEKGKLDFSMSSAYLFFNIGKHINLQFGQSKQFIGEGYRSILLSDNTFNYPFIRLTGTFGKFQYMMLWSQHELFERAYYNYHFRKYYSVNYLSWAPKHGFEFALFESLIWPGNLPDDNNFTINFFNPVLLWRTIQYGLNNEKNVLLGLNTKIRIYDYAQFYGQFAIDRLGKGAKADNNFAFQLGFKHFDLFHQQVSWHKLFAQFEFNYIAPYTYSHENPLQSYTHYNQPLAHPSGSGLTESLGIIAYSYKDFAIRITGSYMVNSLDTADTNFGSNILYPNEPSPDIISHIGNKPGQGIKNQTLKINSELIFTINPSTNMQLFAQMTYRKVNNPLLRRENTIFTIGLRTNLNNYYYDF